MVSHFHPTFLFRGWETVFRNGKKSTCISHCFNHLHRGLFAAHESSLDGSGVFPFEQSFARKKNGTNQ